MKQDLEVAAKMCLFWHTGQEDKNGDPYFLHPFAVMNMCETYEQKIVALLHDILEDTDCQLTDIADNFSPSILEAVAAITRAEGEQYFSYIKRLSHNPLAKYVKVRDLQHNLSRGIIPESLRERYETALKMLN